MAWKPHRDGKTYKRASNACVNFFRLGKSCAKFNAVLLQMWVMLRFWVFGVLLIALFLLNFLLLQNIYIYIYYYIILASTGWSKETVNSRVQEFILGGLIIYNYFTFFFQKSLSIKQIGSFFFINEWKVLTVGYIQQTPNYIFFASQSFLKCSV